MPLNTQSPAWTQPQDAKSMLEKIRLMIEEKRARDPRNWVFEYTVHISHDQAYVMSRDTFEDGRFRIFLHPDHREKIEKAVADWSDEH